jgi:hypothetical protein
MMRRLQPRQQQALSMGFASFLLIFALFATPLLASLQDFSHIHQDATDFHFHNLTSSYLGHVNSPFNSVIVIWTVVFFAIINGASGSNSKAPQLTYSSRAPPV